MDILGSKNKQKSFFGHWKLSHFRTRAKSEASSIHSPVKSKKTKFGCSSFTVQLRGFRFRRRRLPCLMGSHQLRQITAKAEGSCYTADGTTPVATINCVVVAAYDDDHPRFLSMYVLRFHTTFRIVHCNVSARNCRAFLSVIIRSTASKWPISFR